MPNIPLAYVSVYRRMSDIFHTLTYACTIRNSVTGPLGPLFFLLYINDLPQCLNKTKPRLFADDTNLTASGDSITGLETAVIVRVL